MISQHSDARVSATMAEEQATGLIAVQGDGPYSLVAIGKGSNLNGARSTFKDTDGVRAFVEKYNRELDPDGSGLQVYLEFNEVDPTLKKKASKKDVLSFRSLYVDIDSSKDLHATDRATELEEWKQGKFIKLEADELPPTLIIDTGYGIQAIWILRQPVENSSESIQTSYERRLNGLINKYGGDIQCNDCCRIGRLPGSFNIKKGRTVRPSKLLKYEPERLYDLDQFPEEDKLAKAKAKGNAPANGKAIDSKKYDTDKETVQRCVNVLNPDGRDVWLNVGMGLHHQFEGSDEGFRIWDQWSRRSHNYGGTEETWESFGSDKIGKPVTFGTVIKMAQDVDPSIVQSKKVNKISTGVDADGNFIWSKDEIYSATMAFIGSPVCKNLKSWTQVYYTYSADINEYEPQKKNPIRKMAYKFFSQNQEVTGSGKNQTTRQGEPHKHFIDNVLDATEANIYIDEPRTVPPMWTGDSRCEKEEKYPAHEIIALRNGLLHYPSMTFLDPDPDFFSLSTLDFPYEEGALCPTWERIQEEDFFPNTDDEPDDPNKVRNGDQTRLAFQEVWGAILAGVTDYHKIFILDGPPRSGKGVTIRLMTKAVGGSRNVTSQTVQDLGGDFGLQPCIGKRLIAFTDAQGADEESRNNFGDRAQQTKREQRSIEHILRIAGGDQVTIARKGIENLDMILRSLIIFAMNRNFNLTDESGAMAARMMPIVWTGESKLGEEDIHLEEKLEKEMAGIFNWALVGLKRLIARGHFVLPDNSQQLIRKLLKSKFKGTAGFVQARCSLVNFTDHTDKTKFTSTDYLYAQYERFCSFNSEPKRDKATFVRELKMIAPNIKSARPTIKGERLTGYFGIILKDASSTEVVGESYMEEM